MPAQLVRDTFNFQDPTHGAIPCTALVPAAAGPHPSCLFLFGGGGSADTLWAIAPLLERAVADGHVPGMLFACAGVAPMCFYLDDPERGQRWESLVADGLFAALRARYPITDRAGLVGISMGGYGALKIAFARPGRFGAVAAVAPMLEPALHASATPLRNRFHYPPDVPAALLGPARDAALFERDHPALRAQRQADALRRAQPAIWLDAGSRDACHAHDGTELLHRVLWDLDIPHEYHLLRDADHVGPTIAPRLLKAFAWVGRQLARSAPQPGPEEQALRQALAPARARAAALDDSVERCYGRLPDPART